MPIKPWHFTEVLSYHEVDISEFFTFFGISEMDLHSSSFKKFPFEFGPALKWTPSAKNGPTHILLVDYGMTRISSFCSFLINICQNTSFEGHLEGQLKGGQVLEKLTLNLTLFSPAFFYRLKVQGQRSKVFGTPLKSQEPFKVAQ